MAAPAACAQYSSLLAAVLVPTGPRRRPASSSFSRVHIPPAARTAPRSLSVSLSVLRPRAHRCPSGCESAGDDSGFGFSPCDPAAEDPYDIAATRDLSADAGADDGFALQVPFVEGPFELVATTGIAEGAHDDEDDADLIPRVPLVEDPFELLATTGLGEGTHDESDADLVLYVPSVEDPFEIVATTRLCEGEHGEGDAALVLYVPANEDPHELTATTDLCLVPRDDAGLVLHVPTIEEPPEVAATTGLGDGADDVDDDCIIYPTRLTRKDLEEFETMDFSRAAINERFRLESKEAKAAVRAAVTAAVTGAVVGVLSPLRELVNDVRSLDSVFDAEEFHIGLPFAAIMTCMGMYQLWKLSPSTCIDVALYYAFYKLSVIAADVRRRGFAPDWIIRIKLGIIIAVLAKEHGKRVVPLDFIRLAIFSIYAFSVMWDLKGLKKYASSFLPMLFHVLSGGNLLNEEEVCDVNEEEVGDDNEEEVGDVNDEEVGDVNEEEVGNVNEEEVRDVNEEEVGESHVNPMV